LHKFQFIFVPILFIYHITLIFDDSFTQKINMASDPLGDSCPNLFDEEDDLFKPSTEDPLCVAGEDGKGSDADLFEGIDDEIDISDTPTGKEAKLRLDDSSHRVTSKGGRDTKSKDLLQSTSSNYQYNGLFDSPAEVPVTGGGGLNEVRLTPPGKATSASFGPSVRKISEDPAKDSNLELHLNIDIEKYEKRGEGVGSFVVYKVVTKLPVLASGFGKREYSVWRRFSDFLGLHDSLAEKYIATGRIIPPAPSKNVIGMTKTKMVKGTVEEDPVTCEFLERRRASLERYIRRTALHPVLVQDPIFRDFITLEGELPRAIQTAALSVFGVRRLWDRVSDTLNKMACKMDDNDAWFNEKQYEIEQLDDELRKLNHKTEQLVNMRKEYAHSTESFCKSLSMLTACEENTSLSRALSSLCETMEKISQVHQDQAEKDFFILSEMLKDYIALIDIVKAVFFERVKAWNYVQTAQQTLNKRREYKCRLELAGKTERLSQAAKEVDEWNSKLTTAEANFETISKNIQKEYKRFELHRVHEFKQMLIHLLETIASSQQQKRREYYDHHLVEYVIINWRYSQLINRQNISEKMLTVQIVVSLVWLTICGSTDLEFWSCTSNSDCLNGGNCSLPDGRCECDFGFDGMNCQLKVGTCSGSECQNGGSCFQLSLNTYKCLCPYLYDGTFCETPYNFMELGIQLVKRNYLFQAFIIVAVITTIMGYVIMIRKAHRLIKREYVDRNVRKFLSQRTEKELVQRKAAKPLVIKSSSAASIFRRSSDISVLGVKRKSFFDGNVCALKNKSLSGQPIKAPRKEAAMAKDTKRIGKKVCRRKLSKKKTVIAGSQK
ncbi:Sorting nexin-2, partial [Trichinella nelsoni]